MQKTYYVNWKVKPRFSKTYFAIYSLEDNNEIIFTVTGDNAQFTYADMNAFCTEFYSNLQYSFDLVTWNNMTLSTDNSSIAYAKYTLNSTDIMYIRRSSAYTGSWNIEVSHNVQGTRPSSVQNIEHYDETTYYYCFPTIRSSKKCNISGKISSFWTNDLNTATAHSISAQGYSFSRSHVSSSALWTTSVTYLRNWSLFDNLKIVSAQQLNFAGLAAAYDRLFMNQTDLEYPPKEIPIYGYIIDSSAYNKKAYFGDNSLFAGCTKLRYFPKIIYYNTTTGTTSRFWGQDQFANTGNNIVLSNTQTETCPYPVKIPYSYTGTAGTGHRKLFYPQDFYVDFDTTFYCNIPMID